MVVPLGACRKGRWRRGVGICLAMVGAVGTILWLKIAAAGVSYVPFAGSLVTLGFGAWLLRSAVHANGDDRRHLRPQVPLTSGRATVRTGEQHVVGIEAAHGVKYPKVILPASDEGRLARRPGRSGYHVGSDVHDFGAW
jgi:hypothetical protein